MQSCRESWDKVDILTLENTEKVAIGGVVPGVVPDPHPIKPTPKKGSKPSEEPPKGPTTKNPKNPKKDPMKGNPEEDNGGEVDEEKKVMGILKAVAGLKRLASDASGSVADHSLPKRKRPWKVSPLLFRCSEFPRHFLTNPPTSSQHFCAQFLWDSLAILRSPPLVFDHFFKNPRETCPAQKGF